MKLLITLSTVYVLIVPSLAVLVWALIVMGISKLVKSKRMFAYSFRLMISVDQLMNTALNGSEDETISSRAAKRRSTKLWAKALCWLLNKLDPGHCEKAIEHDEGL